VDVLDIFVIIVCLLFLWSEQSIRCAIALLNPIAVVFANKTASGIENKAIRTYGLVVYIQIIHM
jgi:hypothetical protein